MTDTEKEQIEELKKILEDIINEKMPTKKASKLEGAAKEKYEANIGYWIRWIG